MATRRFIVITLLVMTDGRKDCIKRAIPSALASLYGPITQRVIHDDSGDKKYRQWLHESFPTFQLITTNGRSGFGGAIRNAWSVVQQYYNNPFIFHLEDDFVFNVPIDLSGMMEVLNDQPHLYQIALRRQPCNSAEIKAGGVIEQSPHDYRQKERWIEHRKFFTTNPCLYRSSLIDLGWPQGENSEGRFTHQILQSDVEAQFAYWGQKEDAPQVHHIGNVRNGIGY